MFTFKRIFAVVLAFGFSSLAFAVEPEMDISKANILGVSKVKEGMPCYGYSTLGPKGQTKFSCHIWGVLHDSLGPGHNFVVALLEGGNFKETGIISGQSGSPVFVKVKGKEYFVGTVSYASNASKTPIAYLTPAEELLAVRFYGGQSVAIPSVAPTGLSASESLKGFLEKNKAGWLYEEIERGTVSLGLTAISNVSSASVATPKPGDVLGVQLAYGDFSFGGFGTVSYVDKASRKIFLFGHPMFKLGPSEFRLVPAKVLGVQAGYENSHIIAAPIEGAPTIGVIEQDRETGIMGTLGKEPKSFIPYRVKLTTSAGILVEKSFCATNDSFFGPVVGATGVYSVIRSWSRKLGPKTIFLKGEIVADAGTVVLNDVFYGKEGAEGEAAESILGRLELLLGGDDYKKAAIKSVFLNVGIFDEIRLLKIEHVSIAESTPVFPPGSSVTLRIVLSQPEKDPRVVNLKLDIPKDVNFGVAKVMVGSADDVDKLENSSSAKAANLATLLEGMNQKRDPNQIYVYVIYPPAKLSKAANGGKEEAKGVKKTDKSFSSRIEEFAISPSAGADGFEEDGDYVVTGKGGAEIKIGDPKNSAGHKNDSPH